MLADVTNGRRADATGGTQQSVKTFAPRRGTGDAARAQGQPKGGAVILAGPAALPAPADSPGSSRSTQTAESPACSAPSPPPTVDASQQGPPASVVADTSGHAACFASRWLGRANVRRSSVMLAPRPALGDGMAGLVQHQAGLAPHQRARLAAQKRAATVQSILQSLAAYYEEVDAFELVEEFESPVATRALSEVLKPRGVNYDIPSLPACLLNRPIDLDLAGTPEGQRDEENDGQREELGSAGSGLISPEAEELEATADLLPETAHLQGLACNKSAISCAEEGVERAQERSGQDGTDTGSCADAEAASLALAMHRLSLPATGFASTRGASRRASALRPIAEAPGVDGTLSAANMGVDEEAAPVGAAPPRRSTMRMSLAATPLVALIEEEAPLHEGPEGPGDENDRCLAPPRGVVMGAGGVPSRRASRRVTFAVPPAFADAPAPQAEAEDGLQALLRVCGQGNLAVDQLPTMHQAMQRLADLRGIKKVGEGAFGEAFKHGRNVFKVVPIEGDQVLNGSAQKRADEVAPEAHTALALSRLHGSPDGGDGGGGAPLDNQTCGFARTQQALVCRGPYAPALVRAWHAWERLHGSENDPVDGLSGPRQLFLVLAMEDAGRDLEKASVDSWDQVRALITQVVFALAVAEAALEFEHRDMHWGNVLLRPTLQRRLPAVLLGRQIHITTHGVHVSLIDFTASRLRTPDGRVSFCDLEQDPDVFKGPKKDIQFDTYRWMRELVARDWAAPCLATNCLWLAYLAEVLAAHKARGAGLGTAQKRALREFRQRAACAPSATHLVGDPLLKEMWQEVPTDVDGGRDTTARCSDQGVDRADGTGSGARVSAGSSKAAC